MTHAVITRKPGPHVDAHATAIATSVVRLVRNLTALDGGQLTDEERRQIYHRVIAKLSEHARAVPF